MLYPRGVISNIVFETLNAVISQITLFFMVGGIWESNQSRPWEFWPLIISIYLNFKPLEFVSRYRDPQPQKVENYSLFV